MKRKQSKYVLLLVLVLLTGCNKNDIILNSETSNSIVTSVIDNKQDEIGFSLTPVEGLPIDIEQEVSESNSNNENIIKDIDIQESLLNNVGSEISSKEEIHSWAVEAAQEYEQNMDTIYSRKETILKDIKSTSYYICTDDEIIFTFNENILEKYPNLYFFGNLAHYNYKDKGFTKENVEFYYVDVLLNNCLNIIEYFDCNIDILDKNNKINFIPDKYMTGIGKYKENNNKGEEMALGSQGVYRYKIDNNYYIYVLSNNIIVQEDVIIDKQDIKNVLQLIKNAGQTTQIVTMLDKTGIVIEKCYDYEYLLKDSSDSNPIAIYWQSDKGYVTAIGFFGDKVVVRNTMNIVGYQTIHDLGF